MPEHEWIRRDVAKLAEERGIDLARSFPAWCLKFVHGVDPDEALAHTDTMVGQPGGDGGLDGWWRDELSQDFHLWQCKWSDSDDRVFDRGAGTELTDALGALLTSEAAAARGSRFGDVGSVLRRSLDADYDVVLNLGLAGSLSAVAREQLEHSVASLATERGLSMRLEVWDWNELEGENVRRHPTNETLEGVEVKVRLQSRAFMHIDDGDPTLPVPWEVVVASLNASSLGEAAAEFGPRLFSLNVRYALGSNKRIKNLHRSLTDASDNPYFWLYNNGLTIICDDFELHDDANPPSIVLTNPQVVNGCQTVTAFRRRQGEYSDAPSVLARIIRPPSDREGREKALLIAERTNSQNEVQSRDLRSNNQLQVKLAVAFDQIDEPWFYERKRGEWSGLTPSRKRRYRVATGLEFVGLRSRRIGMDVAGQSFRMLFEPADAISKKRDMFEDDDVYAWVFRGNRSPDHYLFAYLLRRRFEAQWHDNQLDELHALIGRHATPGVFRRMLRAKGQMVAHSLALTRMLLQSEEPDPENWSLGGWSLDDARNGQRFAERFAPVAHQWLRLLWMAFKELLDASDAEDEDRSFKRLLERPNCQALQELWTSASAAASFLVGPEWRTEMRTRILAEITE